MSVVWTDRAIRDLSALRAYVAEHSPRAAARIGDAILRAARELASFPEMGRIGRVEKTRELVVTGTPFIMAYTVENGHIAVIAVLHGAQEWPDGF